MLIFALLAAGLGSPTQTETIEKEVLAVVPDVAIKVELAAPPLNDQDKHFFEPRFTTSPQTRGYMVITPTPPGKRSLARKEGGNWLEPPGGWVSPDLKSKRFRIEPLKKPKAKIRIQRGGNE